MRLAFRSLLKNKGFALIALLTLALAVGGATTIFSVLNAVVLRPLPYPESDRLVIIRDASPPRFPEFSVSPGRFLAWQARTTSFETMAAYRNAGPNLTGSGDPTRLASTRVTSQFFDVLQVAPLAGRTFTEEEDRTGAKVIVLAEPFWRTYFGGADLLNKTILVDDAPTVVVGIMPASFGFPSLQTQAWQPMGFTEQERKLFGSHYLALVARMRRGVPVETARADVIHAARDLELANVDDGNKTWTAILRPLQENVVRNVSQGLYVLAGAVGVLLLIACANIANLLIARGIGRQRELGVRAALGASRGRLIRQMVTENLVLGLTGSVFGVAIAWALLRAVSASPSTNLPRASTIGLDAPTLVCALALALLTPLIFGLLPALQISRTDLRDLMAQGGRAGGTALRARTRGALIVAEVALAVMLVAGSMLLIRSFAHLMDVPPGFDTTHQLVIAISPPASRYGQPEQVDQFWTSLLDRVRHTPGVEAVSAAQSLPLIGDFVSNLEIPDRTSTDPTQQPNTNFYAVRPEFFKAMGIPLLHGRVIDDTDTPTSPRVVVISKSMADRFFKNDDPLGKGIYVSQGKRELRTIVGVVGDVKQYGLDAETTLQAYEPQRQHLYLGGLQIVVRAQSDPERTTAGVREALKATDPTLPMGTPRTYQSVLDASVGPRRLTTTLLASFASVALLLAAIGVYGLVSFAVGQRTQEIGVRMALGATPGGVLRLVFWQGLSLTIVGVAIGLAGGLFAARYVESQLFGVTTRDPIAFGLAPVLLIVSAMVACYAPARRALGVDPAIALRPQ